MIDDANSSGHLETEQTLARLGDDRELLEELYAAFSEDAPVKMEALTGHVEAGDLHNVMRQAHSLKGSAAAIGASKCKELAIELESTAGKGDVGEVKKCFKQLQEEMDCVLSLIRQQL